MIFREIRERLTGISCPIFGVSWNPSETERTKAIKIIRFLEDRRVLYNPYEHLMNKNVLTIVFIQ